MTTRLIANKYREGKAKRTLKRELKVLEIVKGEANIAVEAALKRLQFGHYLACHTRETWSGMFRLCSGCAPLGSRYHQL